MEKKVLLEKIDEKDEYHIFDIEKNEEKETFDEAVSEDILYIGSEGEVRVTENGRNLIENNQDQPEEPHDVAPDVTPGFSDYFDAHNSKLDAEEALEDLQNLAKDTPIAKELESDARMAFSFAKDADLSYKEKQRIYRLVNDVRFLARKLSEFSEPKNF